MEKNSIGNENSTNLCKIINNNDSDIVVLLPVSPQTPDVNANSNTGNGLGLLTTSSGKTVIAINSTDTVTLDLQYKDPKTGEMKNRAVVRSSD